MRRVTYYIILTADGMYADPDGGLGHYDPAEDEHRYANDLIREPTDEFVGRRMYEVMDYWDELDVDAPGTPDVEREYAVRYRATRKHVISRGDPPLRPNAELVHGDPVEAIRALKAGDGPDIHIGCGADLFAAFAESGLIDTYRWLVIPKALGSGQRLFASLRQALDLQLTGTRTFSSGAVLLEYEPAGR